jgi:hypothetical protein
MKKLVLVSFLTVAEALLTAASSYSQTIIQRDPVIAQSVAEVSADSLKAHVEKLVSFGTRQTLSGTQGKRGIVPAREWILSKFKEYGRQSEGRLTATIDTSKVLTPTMIVFLW